MKAAVTFQWADEHRVQPIERALAAQMIRGNRRQPATRVRVFYNRQAHRTVIVAGSAVATIERGA